MDDCGGEEGGRAKKEGKERERLSVGMIHVGGEEIGKRERKERKEGGMRCWMSVLKEIGGCIKQMHHILLDCT